MAINAEGYFDCLESYLNTSHYGVPLGKDMVVLKEKIFTKTGDIKQQVELQYEGKIIALKLDTETANLKSKPALFHFLDDTAKPWSKRCDFVLFNLRKSKIYVYCIEFKSSSLSSDGIVAQLNATESWCKSLNHTIKNYTNRAGCFYLSKYVLSSSVDPSPYLDQTNKYLKADNTIRHYNYVDIEGKKLSDLENSAIEIIK